MYLESDYIDRIFHEDCLVGMRNLPDSSIDIIITDLPYGVLNRKNKDAAWDNRIDLAALWEQYERVSKPCTPIILFGSGMFSAELMLSNPKLHRYNLVWVKDRVTGHLNANRMPLRQHEDILVFYKNQPVYHPQMTKSTPDRRNHTRKTTEDPKNRCYGSMHTVPSRIADDKYPTSVIHAPKEHIKGQFLHPTQKPVKLIEYLLYTYSNPGDIVLDSCIGSGTTAVAAIRTRRHYVGYEMDDEYFKIATSRIQSKPSVLSL